MKADAIIFDKDGTLLEFDKFWVKVSEKAIEQVLKKFNIDGALKNEIMQSIGVKNGVTEINSVLCKGTYKQIGQVVCKVLNQNGYNENEEKVIKCVVDAYNDNYSAGEVVATVPNLFDVLNKLKSQNKKLAVVTTDNDYVTSICLKKLGVENLFDKVYTDDGKTPTKPDPYCVFDICEKFGLKKENVIMVGDTLTDVNFAKNAGIKVIGVAKHEFNKKILENNADVVVDDLSYILNLID